PSWGRDLAGAGRRTGPVVAVVSPLVEVPSELSREVNRLIGQVRHWTPARWAAPAADAPDRSRGDLVHGLVQRLADRCAEAEGEPRRRVPRLDNDLALVDQLRVIAADLAAAEPGAEVTASAVADIAAVRRML